MQITYPITFHQTEISWLFLPLFDLLRFILYYFVQAEFFHTNLRFRKGKKLGGNVVFTTTAIRIYFASLTLICKLLFILRISLETKMSNLNSQTLAFLGTLFILAIKTWSFGYLLFFYCLQNNNDVSPISTYKIIIGDIWLTKICIY